MKIITSNLLVIFLYLPISSADTTNTVLEIEHLLTAIGSSNCTFVRNGKHYDAPAAEAHLRMKLKRGKRFVTGAETFIERLASHSSMSKKPYSIECPGVAPVPSVQWLKKRLHELRTREHPGAKQLSMSDGLTGHAKLRSGNSGKHQGKSFLMAIPVA